MVERLSAQNEKATQEEAEARSRAQRCADRCAELETQNAQLQEKIAAAQRLLTNADHDQRLLQVILTACGNFVFRLNLLQYALSYQFRPNMKMPSFIHLKVLAAKATNIIQQLFLYQNF